LAGAEAVVILRVQISAQGAVNSATIVKSSGWKSIDESALTTIRRWHFEPARRAGLPVEIELNLPVEFFLRRS
jgi:protein TonB